jgi:hypothetical protein
MLQYLKTLTLLTLTLAATLATYAQNATDTVSLVVSGQGATLEEARTNALRSAIEQTYGTFISTKTELLNDSLVKDEVVSVANGNILGYETQSQVSIPDGGYSITLRAMVSVKNLTSFVESKGGSVDIKGGVFAANMKLKLLNEKAELAAVLNICDVSWKILSKSVDFQIKVAGSPELIDKDKQLYQLPITIAASTNQNKFAFFDYFLSSLKSLSIEEKELNSYEKAKIPYYDILILDTTLTGWRIGKLEPIEIDLTGEKHPYSHTYRRCKEVFAHYFFLRSKASMTAITNLLIKANIFPHCFQAISNIDTVFFSRKYFNYNYHDKYLGESMFRLSTLVRKHTNFEEYLMPFCPISNFFYFLKNDENGLCKDIVNDSMFNSILWTSNDRDRGRLYGYNDRYWYNDNGRCDIPAFEYETLVIEKCKNTKLNIIIDKCYTLNEIEALNGYRVEQINLEKIISR